MATKEVRLDEIIQLAKVNNLELKMAKKDSTIARENVLTAKMAKLPYLNAGGYYNYIGNPVIYKGFYSDASTIDYSNHQVNWNLSAGIPIYLGGKIKTQIEQQEIVSRIQNELLKMTDAQVKLTVITQFFSLRKLYRQIEIIEKNITNMDVRIKQLESKVKNGQNIISDLTRTKLQLSNFEIDVFNTWNNLDIISNYLCILTGISTATRLKPNDITLEIPEPNLNYETCLATAFNNRFEIKQSGFQKDYSQSSLKMTNTGKKPYLSAMAMYNSQFPIPGTFPPQTDILNYWAVGVGVSYEISGLYNLNHRIKAHKLQIEKDDLNISQTRNNIEQELKTAYVKFLESKKNIESYRGIVELAEVNYRIVKSKYDNEFALIIDMIDAELQVNEAQLSLNNAIIDAINRYYALLHAMGTLN